MKVLDHGYVKYVEHWGSDEHIIEAARMSTQKGFEGWPGDEKLLAYLWKNKHTTPFEMAGLVIEVQAPIFVFREWQRHRTQSYSEASARYAPLPELDYVPSIARLMMSGGANKQAQGSKSFDKEEALHTQEELEKNNGYCQSRYEHLLGLGCPRELARLVLPMARYSKMRASANLWNWLHFLTLRTDKKAQWEIQEYARVVAALVSKYFPRAYKLWADGK